MKTYIETLGSEIARLKRLHPHRVDEINAILEAAISNKPKVKANGQK